jgi:cyclase
MLKKRVIIALQLNDGVLFRTKLFRPDYIYTQSFLGNENADEVCIIDITRYGGSIPAMSERQRFIRPAEKFAEQCLTPLTIGGGIRSIDDVQFLMHELGADKVLINTAAWDHKATLARAIANKFGAQALVVGIDADEQAQAITQQGARHTGFPADEAAKIMRDSGAGEIFLTAIDRDGSLRGYDLDLLRRVAAAVDIPVTIAGGCGGWRHMKEAFEAGADGAATSNIFHLTEPALRTFKAELRKVGAPVRP